MLAFMQVLQAQTQTPPGIAIASNERNLLQNIPTGNCQFKV
jgi:hypothetical protein